MCMWWGKTLHQNGRLPGNIGWGVMCLGTLGTQCVQAHYNHPLWPMRRGMSVYIGVMCQAHDPLPDQFSQMCPDMPVYIWQTGGGGHVSGHIGHMFPRCPVYRMCPFMPGRTKIWFTNGQGPKIGCGLFYTNILWFWDYLHKEIDNFKFLSIFGKYCKN